VDKRQTKVIEQIGDEATLELQPLVEFRVTFSLLILQEFVTVTTLGSGAETLEGLKSARGWLRPIDPGSDFTPNRYDRPILKLSDGRRFRLQLPRPEAWPAAVDFTAEPALD